ncbi:MAG TPA: hypothetical protein VG077_01330 [Verrucomicrobiae bacterium]|nr:hypothetical protein [Verrucomicrobiae bacterium]
MLSLFKRHEPTKGEVTFKNRVQDFWNWYAEVAPRFYQTIEAKNCPSLATEVSAKVDEMLPGFAWVFGPGENGNGHSFTLTGAGNPHRQLLAAFWRSQAPVLPGWTFYPARQPGTIEGQKIQIQGMTFDPIEFWLVPEIDRENKKIDLIVWHPLFAKMEEQNRWTVLFLFLDEVLGEFGTQQWVGEIKLNDQRLAEAMPLQELQPYVKALETETGWIKYPPGEIWTSYRFEKTHADFLRGDIFVGTTSHIPIVNDYVRSKGELPNPLENTGADFVFISFRAAFLPEGKQSEARGRIEDALNQALRTESNGQLLGGAYGHQNAYIDLLVIDGSNSLETVKEVLKEHNLPSGTSINYFAKERRGQRIEL